LRHSSNVKNFHSTLKNITKTFSNIKKFNTPGDVCTANKTFFNAIREKYLQRIVLDGIYVAYIGTYCTSIIFSEKLNEIDGIKSFVRTVNVVICKTIEDMENRLMSEEIQYMQTAKNELDKDLQKKYDDNKKEIKDGNLWIADLKEPMRHICSYNSKNRRRSLFFADATLKYRIINCPRTKCVFFEHYYHMKTMYVMYSQGQNTNPRNYIHYFLDKFNNFYLELGEATSKVNKSNSNLTAIVEEFVDLNPFLITKSEFISAVIFYNQTDFKVAIGSATGFQPYAHRTIQTEGGTIKFIAFTNFYCYPDLPYACAHGIDLV
jgi:hypothetical protein